MSHIATKSGLTSAQFTKFALAAGMLSAACWLPLWRLVSFALGDDLHSYIPLMPLVSAYVAWTFRAELPGQSTPARLPAVLFLMTGAAVMSICLARGHSVWFASPENALAASTLGWLLGLAGVGFWFLGGAAMRALAFPASLLLFMIPLPLMVRMAIEAGLQHGSATVAGWLFDLSGTAFWRNDTLFGLPGITLEVAPECSGIHSTWVLLITSLVAARMILQTPWRRTTLCLAVIPLAFLRNGFRVYVIGELCIHVGPQMIDSPIHHHGGPIFFALSLLPLFLLLYWLKRGERMRPPSEAS